MLNIFYGGENVDKENFIFDNIDLAEKTLILVPDQFSFAMEDAALDYFSARGRRGLINLVVEDFSALGHKTIEKSDAVEPELIDKYGRHMLLSIITQRLAPELEVYGKSSGKSSFAELMNTTISEMKRYGVSVSQIEEAAEQIGKEGATGTYFQQKLQDICKLYAAYEKAIEGKYLDSEDYVEFYGGEILSSKQVVGSQVWIYGFDTFTPINLMVIERILCAAENVNIVMCLDEKEGRKDARQLTSGKGEGLFDLTGFVIQQLEEVAQNAGHACRRSSCLSPHEGFTAAREKGDGVWEDLPAALTLAQTSTIYTEAERAASYITSLVRDEGYRYGDIAVICNDLSLRGNVLRRTFERWGIPAFADQKRNVLHQPVVAFLLSFLEMISAGYRDSAIMSMIKSGLLEWPEEDVELLENYKRQFQIRGTKWKKEFTLKSDTYTDEELLRLNEMRQVIVGSVEQARDSIGRRNTAAEKVEGFYEYLEKTFAIRERIERLVQRQQELGLAEGAAETAQSWNMICGIFQQILRIIGEERISNEAFRDLIKSGIEAMEIGLVPISNDCVIIGTIQRTRLRSTRALVVVGANEGILPLSPSDEGLLNDRELALLEDLKLSISKHEEVTRQEEQLAIYRIFSLPTEKLYVSCSRMDDDGKSLVPSGIFTILRELGEKPGDGADEGEQSGRLCVLGDLTTDEPQTVISSRKSTLSYLAEAVRNYHLSGVMSPEWESVMAWYREHDEADLQRAVAGIGFTNRLQRLGSDMADALYRGDRRALEVSASRLEKYSGCPFAHFVTYGLRAEEQRIFEVGAREIGDVYHECLMEFSRRLTDEAVELSGQGGGDTSDTDRVGAVSPINAAGSPWMNITKEECAERIAGILQKQSAEYKEGLFESGGAQSFRMRRIIDICSDVAWALVTQVRSGRIREMHFEEPFGRGRRIPPIEIAVGDQKVILKGIIDRMDVLDASVSADGDLAEAKAGEESVRIIDYKTGNPDVDVEQMRSGYKLQLMVYMNAALQGSDPDMKPAGVFYFKIKEPAFDVPENGSMELDPAELEKKIQKSFNLEGIAVDDEGSIGAMDPQLVEAKAGNAAYTSQVVPIKYVKTNDVFGPSGGGQLMTEGEFRELCRQTMEHVERICREICEGRVDIAPKRESKKDRSGKTRNSCTYCDYKSICMFDTAFNGCRFTSV